jgi:HEAT repeat protein
MLALSLAACLAAAPVPADPPFPADVQALLRDLGDPAAEVRGRALHELRLRARRVDVFGGQRVRRGEEFAPRVPGLVPYLVKAAGDEAEGNRVLALYALADTLDPAAVAAVRGRLKDKSPAVRFQAACLLTEFKDAGGLDEMKAALKRFRADPKAAGPFDVERLLASLQRLTGKGFGPIPPNPFISSDTRVIAASEARYRELLDTWAAWWDWEPGR